MFPGQRSVRPLSTKQLPTPAGTARAKIAERDVRDGFELVATLELQSRVMGSGWPCNRITQTRRRFEDHQYQYSIACLIGIRSKPLFEPAATGLRLERLPRFPYSSHQTSKPRLASNVREKRLVLREPRQVDEPEVDGALDE